MAMLVYWRVSTYMYILDIYHGLSRPGLWNHVNSCYMIHWSIHKPYEHQHRLPYSDKENNTISLFFKVKSPFLNWTSQYFWVNPHFQISTTSPVFGQESDWPGPHSSGTSERSWPPTGNKSAVSHLGHGAGRAFTYMFYIHKRNCIVIVYIIKHDA